MKLEILSRERAGSAVPLEDCSGQKYENWLREDIIRYVLEGAEIQRDKDIDQLIAQDPYRQAEERERQRVCGDILHYLVASRQEIINKIEERAKHKGVVRVTRWHKCVDEIIGWVKLVYNEGVELDDEFVCFHITTKDRVAGIMKEGLKPNAEPSWFESPTPYVMLSKYPYWELYEKDMVLLEIKHPDILPEYFADPEGLRWGEIIPPGYINKVVDFKVRKDGGRGKCKRGSAR